MDIRDLYQELIIEHGTCPRNCGSLPLANATAEGHNALCGDQLTVYLEINNQHIEKAAFIGSGCAISVASASLMTEAITHQTIEQALALSQQFKDLLTTSVEGVSDLGKLQAFAGVKAYPARVKCATLCWHTFEGALANTSKRITTE